MKNYKLFMFSTPVLAVLLQFQSADVMADDVRFDEIVVTAQKREQRLIDVPMSITAIAGEELDQRGVETIQDLSFSVPGLTMREDGPGSYTIFLRGLANQYGSGALVSLFLDESPLSGLSPVALDLARVEVLKGPQGTLYGQGAAGGAIRYITNSPVLDTVEGRVEGQLYTVTDGDTGWKGTGVINLPLVEDKLAFRLAASYEDGGGWIDQPEAGIRDGNGTELLNTRGKLLWVPSDSFEAEAMIQIHRASTRLGMGYEEADRTVDIGPDRSKEMLSKEFDFTLYNLELRFDLGFADLVGITTYVDHDHQYPFTYIPRPGNFSYGYVEGNDDRFEDYWRFSQELRLTSSGDGPLDWTLGAYYSDSESEFTADYEYLYAGGGDLYEGGGDLYQNLYYYSTGASETYSLYADGAYRITDRLTFGAGIRYFHDSQTSLIEYAPDTGTLLSNSFSSVDPRAYVSYSYSDQANVYASAAKGFRSGGFNVEPFDPYEPEEIYTYELGTKGAVLNGMLQYEVAGFYTFYEDMVRRRLVFIEGAYRSESSNIAEVEVQGIELGLAYRPTDPLMLTVTGSWLDSEITDTHVDDPVNIAGDRMDYTPKRSFTLGANYDLEWAPEVPGFIRIDFNYRDEVTYVDRSSFFPEVLPQESDRLALLNARIGIEWKDIGFELYGLNLTNENDSIDPYHGWANANRTRPRLIGLKAGYNF